MSWILGGSQKMNEEEIAKTKSKLSELLKFHIQAQKLRLEVLESLQMQLEHTKDINELKKIHDDLAMMLGMKK